MLPHVFPVARPAGNEDWALSNLFPKRELRMIAFRPPRFGGAANDFRCRPKHETQEILLPDYLLRCNASKTKACVKRLQKSAANTYISE
jgi:hypothetical protein